MLLPAGARLGPAQIALLAATGHGSVLARAMPRVAVLATGNELSEPGSPLVPGQIWESNSYMLAAAVRQAGGSATRHRAGDDPETVLALIGELSTQADLLITSGGVSMGGEHDVVKAALSGSGRGRSRSARSPCSPACRRASAWSARTRHQSSPCPVTRSARSCRSGCSAAPPWMPCKA